MIQMKQQLFRPPALSPPARTLQLPAKLMALKLAAENSLLQADPLVAKIATHQLVNSSRYNRMSGHLKCLSHPLSDLAERRWPTYDFGDLRRSERGSSAESVVLQNFDADLRATLSGSDSKSLETILIAIASMATQRQLGIRAGHTQTVADRAGAVWRYPSPDTILPSLHSLHEYLQSIRSDLLAAVVGYAMVITTHPFNDGNGRTSRILFNAVLHQFGVPINYYFPLKELFALSRRGLTIHLRELSLGGDWVRFATYFFNSINAYFRLYQAGLRNLSVRHHNLGTVE